MTRVTDLLGRKRCVSIELWPPRNEQAERRLESALGELLQIAPDFCSITYGAGGSTRERTHDLVVRLRQDGVVEPMAHLVCAAHRRDELVEILERYRDAGIENLLVLRGDPPLFAEAPLPPGDLRHAVELVRLAKDIGDFCVAVAAHPESHPDSPDRASDRRHLAEKLEVADLAITQFFFCVEDYLDLVDELDHLGCAKPVVPGVMPITNARTVDHMAELAGCVVPRSVADRIAAAGDQPGEVRRIGIEIATTLCEKLLAEGVPGLHFYTMNQSRATLEICANLGLAPPGG